ncbi:MAG: MFS transporter [Actinobacteria bacterium]|nr:MFS transporter [Actinomycetota bacterium]
MSEPKERKGFRAALAHKDFRLLLASLTTSGIGDWFYNIALVVYILEETSSPGWVAAAGIGRLAPYILLGSLGGVVADRFDRRKVMVTADVARAALMLALAGVVASGAPVAFAIGIAFLSTAAGTPFFPAVAAVTPSVVDEKSLAAANALITTVDSLAIALGPALGGLLLTVTASPVVAFIVNATTFGISALLLGRVSLPRVKEEERPEVVPLHHQLAEGVRAITSSTSIMLLIALLLLATFACGLEIVLYPLVSKNLLGTGAEGVGFLFAALGVGGVAAAGLANRAVAYPRPALILTAGSLMSATPFAFLPLTTSPAAAYVLVAIQGGGLILIDVLATTLMQRAVRESVMARVFGILDSIEVLATVLGAAIAPLLIESFGLKVSLLVAGGILVALTLLCVPKLFVIDRGTDRRRLELEPKVQLMSRLGIFEGMPRQSLEALAASASEEAVSGGDVLIREGDDADDFFVIRSGAMEVLSSGEAGAKQTKVRDLGAGDYAGEIGLIERIPRTATVRATLDSLVFRIGGREFVDAVSRVPSVSSALSGGIAGRLARTHPSYRPNLREKGTEVES